MEFSIPEIIDNRYRVIQKIGSGAMATVYSAEDTRLGRQVAVKVLRSEHASNPTSRARFQREAEAVASLNHPNIVSVYDTGVFDAVDRRSKLSVPFMVMELVQGQSLRQMLTARGELPVDEALGYSTQILAALQYASDTGIVHRDIKPANVMVLPLTEEDISKSQYGQVKVMDFGIASALEPSGEPLTRANTVMGTARYISPEQARGETVDSRSDIYSAACLIFEMLSGHSPFDADSSMDLAAKHLSETPQPPSAYAQQAIPSDIDAAVLRALSKSRSERFPTAQAFSDALRLGANSAPGNYADVDADTQPTATLSTMAAPGVAAGAASTAGVRTGSYAAPQTGATSPVEDAGLGGWFENAQSEYTDEELYDYERNEALARKKRRRQAWRRVLTGMLITALALFSIGTVLYYQNELNRTPTHAVPAVQGMSRDEAETALRNSKLSVKWEEEYSDQIEKDHVVKSSPVMGTQVDEGSEVTLTLSKGPAKLTVPDNLEGQSEAYVRSALEEAGFKAGRTSTVNHPTIPAGMVVEVKPGSGQPVDAGATIDIVLSNGRVTVPNVTGLSRDEAISRLSAPEVMLSTNVETVQTSEYPAGTVISQSAAADTSVEQGSTVTIQVASAPPARVTVPSIPASQPTYNPAPNQGNTDDAADNNPAVPTTAPSEAANPAPSAAPSAHSSAAATAAPSARN